MCWWTVEVREPSADPVGAFARRAWGWFFGLAVFIAVFEVLDLVMAF